MKILLVTAHLRPTEGWGTEALTSVRGLRAQGHDVQALVHLPYEGDPCVQHVHLPAPLTMLLAASTPMTLLRGPLSWIQTWVALRRCVRHWHPDVIHITTEPYAFVARFLPRSFPPLALTLNGTWSVAPLLGWTMRSLLIGALRRAKVLLPISVYTRERVLSAIRALHSTLATELQKKMRIWTLGTEAMTSLPQAIDRIVKNIVFVGEVKHRKGVAQIIEACGAFAKTSATGFRLHIIGSPFDAAYLAYLKKLVASFGLQERVIFHGRLSEEALAARYAEADLFMMLSLSEGVNFEGYGLVFLEANARGIPVIGSLDSGCMEVIADGRSGYLVPAKETTIVAERMRWILDEKRIPSYACIEWVKEHSIERQARELEQAYALALQAR
jgi:glycosyltransferase involved in cell wall biosynthesis